MKIAIDIPNNLHIGDLTEIFNHLEAIYVITSGIRSGPIGFTTEEKVYIENDISALAEAVSACNIPVPKGVPALTKKEMERDREIAKVLKSVNGSSADKTRLAKTCYKNLTKIYGIVWVQAEKDFKKKWNVDEDIKISKRRCVVSSENLFNLYITQLKTMRDHHNANVAFWAN